MYSFADNCIFVLVHWNGRASYRPLYSHASTLTLTEHIPPGLSEQGLESEAFILQNYLKIFNHRTVFMGQIL